MKTRVLEDKAGWASFCDSGLTVNLMHFKEKFDLVWNKKSVLAN